MVRAQLHLRFSFAAFGATVICIFQNLSPKLLARFGTRLLLLAEFRRLQLICASAFDDRSEALIPLEFAQAPERVDIGYLAFGGTLAVDKGSKFFLGNVRAGNTVAFRPQSPQYQLIISAICRSGRNKAAHGLVEPLPLLFKGVGRRGRGGMEDPLARARLLQNGPFRLTPNLFCICSHLKAGSVIREVRFLLRWNRGLRPRLSARRDGTGIPLRN